MCCYQKGQKIHSEMLFLLTTQATIWGLGNLLVSGGKEEGSSGVTEPETLPCCEHLEGWVPSVHECSGDWDAIISVTWTWTIYLKKHDRVIFIYLRDSKIFNESYYLMGKY